MKKVLLGVMILSIITGVVAVFLGLNERARFRKQTEDTKAMWQEAAYATDKCKLAEERDKALADLEVEKTVRLIAEQKRDEALQALAKADEEVAVRREPGKMATKAVSFVGSFSRVLFPCIDDGDDYYIQGLTTFDAATKQQGRFRAIGFINKARDKYVDTQGKLKKLVYIDDQTREIIELAMAITEEKIKSVQIMRDYLNTVSEGKPDSSKQQEAGKYIEKADRLMIEVCNKLLEVIDTYREGFTKAQLSHIQALKTTIEERLGVEEDK